jgi:hypothetical protein
MYTMHKKAQIEAGVNWIFIIVAGAIILLFFASVAAWYKSNQETKISGQVVVKLDSMFTSAIESPRTAKSVTIPDLPIHFTCDNDCNKYGCPSYFSGGAVSRDSGTEVVFSMANLEANNLISWALNFKIPYKVTNFLYLTNDQIRYIIIYDTASEDLFEAVNDVLSENPHLNLEAVFDGGSLEFEDYNDDFVRIVSLTPNKYTESDFEEFFSDSDFDFVDVDGSEISGYVYFNEGVGVQYYGIPMLIGAIFSENSEFYECNVNKALLLSSYVSYVYEKRTQWLFGNLPTTPEDKTYCDIYYTDADVVRAIQIIGEMSDVTLFEAGDLSSAIITIENNDNLAIINDCPRLY